MSASLSLPEISRELESYQVSLSPTGLEQLAAYLELLLRWNRRVNLTAIRQPREIVRQLFGESLYLSRLVDLKGWLVDIGSGAGFPGLALKLVTPDLKVTLVEARHKKCAFLKEVTRTCGFSTTEVVTERFEEWARLLSGHEKADIATTRAVVVTGELLDSTWDVVRPGGKLAIFTTSSLASGMRRSLSSWTWDPSWRVPGTVARVILVGKRR